MLTVRVFWVGKNSGYARPTASKTHFCGVDVAARAAGFGIPGVVVDGTDFFAVHAAAGEAIRRARAGDGPTLLECKAIRFFGHMEGWDDQAYRPEGEEAELRADHDCLANFRRKAGDAVDILFVDFAGVCFDQILNQAAKLRYMVGGKARLPLVIRVMYGAGMRRGAQHSQALYPLFAHIPGLKVAVPSSAYDAKGLMLQA